MENISIIYRIIQSQVNDSVPIKLAIIRLLHLFEHFACYIFYQLKGRFIQYISHYQAFQLEIVQVFCLVLDNLVDCYVVNRLFKVRMVEVVAKDKVLKF